MTTDTDLAAQVEQLRAQKDGAYAERNKLVALMAALFPSSLERHVGDDWEDDWRNVVYVQLPTGSASWHIHDSELPIFSHVTRNRGWSWDGHTTEEKYRRVLDAASHIVTPDSYQLRPSKVPHG